MTREKDTVYSIKRLKSKNARAAIIQKISAGSNLMPLISHFSDRLIREYLSLYEEYQHTDHMTLLLHPEPIDKKRRSSHEQTFDAHTNLR